MPAGEFLSGFQRQPVLAQTWVEQIFGRIGFVHIHVIAHRIGTDLRSMRRVLQLPGAVYAGQSQHALDVLRGCGPELGLFRRRATEIAFATRLAASGAGIFLDQ